MNKRKWLWLIVIIVIIAAVWIGASNSNNSNKSGLKIGLISILSGEYSSVGQNFANGAVLAQETYNKNHPNNQIELFLEDDGFDTAKSISAYKKLTSINKIDALINVSTPAIGAIYNDLSTSGMPTIQNGEQPNEATDDNVFQVFPGSLPVEKELGKYLKAQNFKKPIIIYTQHDGMIRLKNAFLKEYGSSMPEFTSSPSDTDFRTLVSKIASEKPDVIVVLMFPQPGAQFLNEYKKQTGSLPQLAFDANAQSGFADYSRILGNPNVLNGSIMAKVQQEVSPEFVKAYKERFGTEPGFMADMGYDAFNLLVQSAANNNKTWVNNLKKANFPGVSGQIKFDEAGVRLPVVKIVKITDGAIPAK